TFLYTPGETTKGFTHIRDGIEIKRIMTVVIIALIPCVIMGLYNTGLQTNLALHNINKIPENIRFDILKSLGVPFNSNSILSNLLVGLSYFLPIYIMTLIVGGLWELIFSLVRKHEVTEGFFVTSLLYPLILPPSIPLWQAAAALSAGIVLGKEVFGGTGKNIVNPALIARAMLFFSYPSNMTGDTVWVGIDGITQGTPLGLFPLGEAVHIDKLNSFIGLTPGSIGETSTLACLIGAFILILSGIGSWRIMISAVFGFLLTSSILYLIGSNTNPTFNITPLEHLLIGGFAFATVYMATDPVSAANTQGGQYIYGFLIGFLTILVRVLNPAFPEGAMLAVLFGNITAPIIDMAIIKYQIKRLDNYNGI
ncbi:MAG: NADH:ubiquinone reductase (Na(+)-transporting) subunit B, partial [Deferribacterota bacterium]|nr:NADH:ubiquinone reductase (Na(+)-transporting) subunit B [Deferribacterota bacterium]